MKKVYIWKIIDETIYGDIQFAIKQIEVFRELPSIFNNSIKNKIDISAFMIWEIKWVKRGFDWTDIEDRKPYLEEMIKKRFRLKKDTELRPHKGDYMQYLNNFAPNNNENHI